MQLGALRWGWLQERSVSGAQDTAWIGAEGGGGDLLILTAVLLSSCILLFPMGRY